ncbi:MAG: glycosyltransferase family 2 protein [Bacteroidales bacterium]|nr:glycosyltransferase family 2 protein [Bacteroidales bacterium]MBN2756991.1 glycosyltransferase family 2 protein [Bacteroidales bacterium]
MKLSIIIPAFNEERNIHLLYSQITESLSDIEFECIFVDDGSEDKTFAEIKILADKDKRVKGLSLSRNFGHQTALLAGLNEAKNEIVITMDADGQHPPEVIKKLIEEHLKGYDIVNTRRISTADTKYMKKLFSKWYYKILNTLTDVQIEPASSDFRLMSRKTVDAYLKIEERDRFTRGLIKWMGFKQSIIEFDAPERMTGTTKYTLNKMLRLAFDGITAFSSKPLKISLILGFSAILLGLIYSVYVFVAYISGNTTSGWTSTMLVILFLGGFQLLSIGIIGEYIARIFNESKNRPHYFIKDKC